MTNAKGEHDPKNREAIIPQVCYISVPVDEEMPEPMDLIIIPQTRTHKHEFFRSCSTGMRKGSFSSLKLDKEKNHFDLC